MRLLALGGLLLGLFVQLASSETSCKIFQNRDLVHELSAAPPSDPLRIAIDAGKRGSGKAADWMDELKSAHIRAVDLELNFIWTGKRIDNVKIAHTDYYRTYLRRGSRIEKEAMDDSIGAFFPPVILSITHNELQDWLSEQIAKRGFQRAYGTVIVTVYDDPCLPHVYTAGADSIFDSEISPLIHAAASARYDECARLIEKGSDVNARDHKGVSALMIAAFVGDSDIVNLLLKHGASIDLRDKDGRTALHYAAEGRNGWKSVPLLIEAGADINAKSAETAVYLPKATPLIIAAADGNLQVVQLLLAQGADKTARTTNGLDALGLAIQPPFGKKPEHAKIIDLLR